MNTAIDVLVRGERAWDQVYEIQRYDVESTDWVMVERQNKKGAWLKIRYRTLRKARENVPDEAGLYRIVNMMNGAVYRPT